MNEETTTQKTFIDRDSLIKRRYREGEVTTSLNRSFTINGDKDAEFTLQVFDTPSSSSDPVAFYDFTTRDSQLQPGTNNIITGERIITDMTGKIVRIYKYKDGNATILYAPKTSANYKNQSGAPEVMDLDEYLMSNPH